MKCFPASATCCISVSFASSLSVISRLDVNSNGGKLLQKLSLQPSHLIARAPLHDPKLASAILWICTTKTCFFLESQADASSWWHPVFDYLRPRNGRNVIDLSAFQKITKHICKTSRNAGFTFQAPLPGQRGLFLQECSDCHGYLVTTLDQNRRPCWVHEKTSFREVFRWVTFFTL